MMSSSKEFFKSVGFDVESFDTIDECKQAMRNMWLLFDKFGNIKGLKTCGMEDEENGTKYDFRSVSGDDTDNPQIMSNWLRENNLYASALYIFLEREPGFYELNFLDKLAYFGWVVENGQLINTAW